MRFTDLVLDWLLATLIRRVTEKKEGYWEDRSWMAIQKAVSLWAPELVISDSESRVFLCKYEGGVREFTGCWHLPGGYGTSKRDNFLDAVNAVAWRELTVFVENPEVLCVHMWGRDEHPDGRPLSVFTHVMPVGSHAMERLLKKGEFFSLYNLPVGMVPVHRRVLVECIKGKLAE